MSSSAHDRFQHRRSQQQSQQKLPQKPAQPDELETPPRREQLREHRAHASAPRTEREGLSEHQPLPAREPRRSREPFAGSEPREPKVNRPALPNPFAQLFSGRRKFYFIAAAAAVMLVWFLPTIAGWTSLPNSVLSSILADLNGSVSSSSASLGWFSPVTLHNVEIRDERGDLVLKIPTLKTSRSLRQLMTDSKSLGYVQVENPQLLVAFDERGSNLERVLAKYLDPRRPQTMDSPAVELDLVNGTAAVEDRVNRVRYQVDGLDAKLAMYKDWAKPMSLQLAGKVPQQHRTGQVGVQLEVSRQREADGTIASSGTAHLTTNQFPLALAQPIVQQLAPRTEISGWLNGEGDYGWGGATVGGDAYADRQTTGQTVLDAQFTGEGLVIRSPALPKDVIKINRLHAPCRMVCQDDQLRIERLGADCDIGQMTLDKGAIVIDLRAGLAAGILDALRRNQYSLQGRVDLAQLAKVMPETLAVRRGTEITSGTVDVEFARLPEGKSAAWQGKLTSSGLQAVNEGRAMTWENPIQMEFAALETRTGLQIRSLSCRSDFVTIRAQGQLTSPTIMAEYDLDMLATKLGDFFDLKPARVAGRGWTQVEWQDGQDGRFAIWSETQIENFALRMAKGQPWNGEKVQVKCHLATEANPQTKRMQRLTKGELTVVAGDDRLSAKLTKPVDLAALGTGIAADSGRIPERDTGPAFAGAAPLSESPTRVAIPEPLSDRFGSNAKLDDWRGAPPGLGTSPFRTGATAADVNRRGGLGLLALLPPQGVIPVEIDLRGSLARWAARLEAFAGPLPWRIEGECQVLATADLSQQLIEIKRSQTAIRGFRAANENWLIDEPTLAISLEKAAFRPESGRADVTLAQAFGEKNQVALELRNVAVALPNEPGALPEIHGDVIFNLYLSKLQQWSRRTSQSVKPPYLVFGVANGQARFSRNGQVSAMQCSCNVRDFILRSPDAKEGWRDPEVTAIADVRYDRWSDVLKINRLDVDSKTKAVSCRSQGQITEMKGRRQLDLRGDVSYELQQLALALFPTVGKEIEIASGRNARPFFVKGPLSEPPLNGNAPPGDSLPADPPQPLLARLSAGTQVDWTGANVYGFRFAAGEIRAQLQNGQVYFEPLNLAVNDGRMTAEPQIDLVGRQPKVILKAGRLLDHVRITPEMCKRGLKYAVPALYNVTDAQGQFSVNIKGCEFPLDDPGRGERAGELVVHDVQVAPGPVLQQLAQAIDALRLVTGKQAATPWRAARLKRESVVEYVMRDGKVYHRNLELDFDGVAIKTRGWVGLDQTISIEARVAAPKLASRVPGLPGLGGGPTEVMIPITGTLDRPQLDRSRLGDAFKGMLSEDLLRKPAEGLLNNPADGLRRELEDRTKGVIKGLDSGLEKLLPRPR